MQILISGGSASGKSQLAEQLAVNRRQTPLYYFATMQIWDVECAERVTQHRRQRTGKGFQTIEVPDHLLQTAQSLPTGGCGLLECVSNLLSNEQFCVQQTHPAEIILDGIATLHNHLDTLVIVTNEVFIDKVPQDAAMQAYLQQLGRINCTLAERSEIVIEVCSGIPVCWKGAALFHEVLS